MNDNRNRAFVFREDALQSISVANVRLDVAVTVDSLLEILPSRTGAPLVAEEIAAHVVVDADDVEARVAEMNRRLGSDQAACARDHRHSHDVPPSLRDGRGWVENATGGVGRSTDPVAAGL
jgi:hypothetical protein